MNQEQYNQQHKYWKEDHDRVWAEINFNSLADDLCRAGWTKIVLNPMTTERSADIDRWTDCTCVDQFKNMGLVWLFKNRKDAMMFTLVWA